MTIYSDISKHRAVRFGDLRVSYQKGRAYVLFSMPADGQATPDTMVRRALSRLVAEARLVLKDIGGMQ